MKKIIFCNLDLLKRKNIEGEYLDYDFTNFDYEQLATKRMLFIKGMEKLCEEDQNIKVFPYRRKQVKTIGRGKQGRWLAHYEWQPHIVESIPKIV